VKHFCVVAFDAVGFTFIGHGRIQTRRINQIAIGSEQIAVVEAGLRSAVD